MSGGPNLDSPDFDEPREPVGVPPGQAAYPYHWHYREEELLVVLEGSPWLRTANGNRRLARGEVVRFRPARQAATRC